MVRRCVVVYVCYGDTCRNELNENPTSLHNSVFELKQGRPQGGAFCPEPQPGRGPRRPHEGPFEYLFKRSIYSNRAVRSRYSNRAVTVFFRGAV